MSGNDPKNTVDQIIDLNGKKYLAKPVSFILDHEFVQNDQVTYYGEVTLLVDSPTIIINPSS